MRTMRRKSKRHKKTCSRSIFDIEFEKKIWEGNVEEIQFVAGRIKINNYIINDDKYQIDLRKKIMNRISKVDIGSFEEFIDDIVENKILASYLAKNPSKQQPWQHRFFKLLEKIVGEDDSKELVTANSRKAKRDRLFLNNDGEVSTIKRGDERDIDAIISQVKLGGRDKVKYISHKRIGGEGSSQRDQFAEVKLFLKYAAKNMNPRESFILAYEGDYFSPTKIDEFKELCSWDCVHIVEATDVERIVKLINI